MRFYRRLPDTAYMAEEPTPLSEVVADAAQKPAEVAVAGMGMSREQRLPDLIQAAKFTPSTTLARRHGAGIRFTKARAGGAV